MARLSPWLPLSALLLAAAGGAGWWWTHRAAEGWTFQTTQVQRRDVTRVVSATGAVTADPTVEVGTQVSGIVAELLVDFNTKVTKGQVLARIDTTLLDADVASAAARLAEAKAERDRLALEARRVQSLHAAQAATDQEREAAEANLAVAEAQLRSAQVTRDRARRNLGYATITAPIDGTVLRRDVDVGQTVNAGFSAPTLFQLAGDLSRVLVLAKVDESDIGQIHDGQLARVTVPAWPDKSFEGVVRQVRLDSAVDQSVVTYTVVVDLPNPDGALFPGMTATVDFVVAEAKDVLCVASGALRYSPDEGVPVIGERPAARGAGAAGGTGGAGGASGGWSGKSGEGGRPAGAKRRSGGGGPGPGTLWLAEGTSLKALPVTTGLRGADCTEISGEGLREELEVVVGAEQSAGGTAANPFQQKAGDPRRPGGF